MALNGNAAEHMCVCVCVQKRACKMFKCLCKLEIVPEQLTLFKCSLDYKAESNATARHTRP